VVESLQILEWQNQARAEAEVTRLRKDLLRALRLRFQGEVPPDLATAIERLTDVNDLEHWFDASQTAASLKAFRAVVQQ
jgi:hypothetical protein